MKIKYRNTIFNLLEKLLLISTFIMITNNFILTKKESIISAIYRKCLISKADKLEGAASINKSDYKQSMDCLFSIPINFKVLKEYLTIRSSRTVQNYLNNFYNLDEITELGKKEMRPKFAQIVKAHGLTVIHKS